MGTTRAREKLSEIMETQKELQAQSIELERLAIAEQEYDQRTTEAEMLRHKIADVSEMRANLDLSTPEGAERAVRYDRDLARLRDEFAKIDERRKELKSIIDPLKEVVDSDKNFDKMKLFRNIRKLLSFTGIKLGQIEREAGCQPGYMSRLEKAGNTTDPTVEFVVTAAKALEVSIDLLVYQDFGKMTETELYILRFLNSLARDTKDDRMVWKINNLGKYIETAQSGGVPNDPLFNYLVGVEQKKDSAQYRSLFSGKILRCVENSFVGNLRGSDAQMYILRCADDAAKQNEAQQFFEIYIVSEKKVNPLLCTAQTREALVSAVDQLFEAVEISATHIHLNEDVKAVIDLYFNPIFS